MSVSLKVEKREAQSKGKLNQLRQSGKVPGVVYGQKIEQSSPIAVDEKELQALLRSTPNAVLEIDVPTAGKQPVMITDIQRDSLSKKLLHVDLHQIDMNTEVTASVRIEAEGEAPGVKEGGVLQMILHELEISCLPNKIPESIAIDISELQIGESLSVAALKLPEGVSTTLDPEMVIVSVLAPQKEALDEEAEEASSEPAAEADAEAEQAEEGEQE
ncbi:50S ribosomal protein L25/general stress protein Ctc [Paenibacillus sp. 598K]|uniref:50S ribosomal protein L25/general stress protein Ctc n=1 Tax=Paenibacillus sp. 598K TaxID=1117987 RepID=UPI000FFA9E49|nr:50S ribosomal protein L25/general stress protein Ctc [Paenibacillus sp. 598K]GBF78337.1 50S ribosomal protein L25/general stress protein Ctc [Paenibacillus sp. 598K]